jgi:hypothetical protein
MRSALEVAIGALTVALGAVRGSPSSDRSVH